MEALKMWLFTIAIVLAIIVGICVFARCEGGDSKLEHFGEVVGGIAIVLLILAIIIL